MTLQELKWPGVVLVLGLLLIIVEWNMASKKKGGVTFTDRQRMKGLAGVSVALSILVYFLIWFA
ncbi:MAG: hypothetical protein MUF79_07175 [Burkholderiales bacterium]|jgi:hypothetical protein|nr:hypothetical protein [Burkholderiales bacterium]